MKGERAEILINRYINSIVNLNDQREPSRIVITKKTGIFYSDDRGENWTRAETDIAAEDDFAFKRLYLSNTNPKRIYATAGLIPNDPSADYCTLNTSTTHNVTKLQGGVYRSDDDDSYYDNQAGIYKSTDGGKTWHDITGIAALDRYTYICIDPFDREKIHVGTFGAGAFVGIDNAK